MASIGVSAEHREPGGGRFARSDLKADCPRVERSASRQFLTWRQFALVFHDLRLSSRVRAGSL